MTTFIEKSTTSHTGYSLTIYDGETIVKNEDINKYDPTNPNSLKLPENPTGRKFLAIRYLEALPYEVPEKQAPKCPGPKGLEKFLTDEEKATIEQIYANARERREAAKPKLTEREKLEQKIAKLKAALELMESEG